MSIIEKAFSIIYHPPLKNSITIDTPWKGKDAIAKIAATVPADATLIPKVGMDKPIAIAPQYAAAASNVFLLLYRQFLFYLNPRPAETHSIPPILWVPYLFHIIYISTVINQNSPPLVVILLNLLLHYP